MTPNTIMDVIKRFSSLEKKIGLYCRQFSNLAEQDELMSDIRMAFIERQLKESTFAYQKDAYLVQYAKWQLHKISENKRQANNSIFFNAISIDGDKFVESETIDLDFDLDEIIEAKRLAVIVKKLNLTDRKVCKLLYLGFNQIEIAKELKVTPQAVWDRIDIIRSHIKSNGYEPAPKRKTHHQPVLAS